MEVYAREYPTRGRIEIPVGAIAGEIAGAIVREVGKSCYKLYARTYQRALQAATYFVPWPQAQRIEGEGALGELPLQIKSMHIKNVLIVTDKGISSLGLMNGLLEGLKNASVGYVIYDETVPNPTTKNVEEALSLYKENHCQALIAFGGGSPMDCAKGVGARLARPEKTLAQMKGLMKVKRPLPPLFAIPTTAGTGSETTITAVISDADTHVKYPMHDMAIIPQFAVLDPALTVGLPPHITAATGMDALSHAVEAYIGKSNTVETKKYGRDAVRLIFDNLYLAYSDGQNMAARENMLRGSHYAGIAFARAYIGYVHSMAHALGGMYGIPHGMAIATVMPYVLEYYGKSAHKPLAELADVAGISRETDTPAQKAEKLIQAIRELNRSMNIPEKVSELKSIDIPELVQRAAKEANPSYPVPKILFEDDLSRLFYEMME